VIEDAKTARSKVMETEAKPPAVVLGRGETPVTARLTAAESFVQKGIRAAVTTRASLRTPDMVFGLLRLGVSRPNLDSRILECCDKLHICGRGGIIAGERAEGSDFA
jgi:hypothetical protein